MEKDLRKRKTANSRCGPPGDEIQRAFHRPSSKEGLICCDIERDAGARRSRQLTRTVWCFNWNRPIEFSSARPGSCESLGLWTTQSVYHARTNASRLS